MAYEAVVNKVQKNPRINIRKKIITGFTDPDPGFRAPGWGNPDQGYDLNVPDHISECLMNV